MKTTKSLLNKHIAVIFAIALLVMASMLLLAPTSKTTAHASSLSNSTGSATKSNPLEYLDMHDIYYIFELGEQYICENPGATEDEIDDYMRGKMILLSIEKQNGPSRSLTFIYELIPGFTDLNAEE